MAQYRAIFQNAYFKGLAAAAVVTMGLAAGQAQAANPTDLTGFAGTDKITMESGSNSNVSLSGSGSLGWNAPVEVVSVSGTGNHSITINTEALTLSGTGSLTIKTGEVAKGLELAASGGKAITVDIGSVDVQSGLLQLKNTTDQSGDATLSANTITIGDGKNATTNAVIKLGDASASSGTATLGSGSDLITLQKGGKIEFAGSGSDTSLAVLAGNLQATGGELDFTSGSGKITAYGSASDVNISVGTEKKALIELTDTPDTTANEGTLNIKSGIIKLTGSATSGSGSLLQINKGSVVLGDGVVLTATDQSASGTASILVGSGDTAELSLSKTTLDNFLNGTATVPSGTTAASGSVVLISGTLAITGDDQVTLNELTFASGSNTGAAGTIVTSGAATLKADDILISGAVQSGGQVDVVGKNLTLTSADAAGVKSLTAQNVTFGDGSKAYDLKDGLTLAITKQIADPYKTDGSKATVADSGKMANAVNLSGSGALTIAAGIYESNGDITLKSGSLKVGSGASSTYSGTDAQLTLSSNDTLKLDNSGGTNAITIQGNGELSFGPNGAAKEQSTGILDISAGELEIVDSSSAMTTITAHSHGALIVSEDQALDILNMSATPRQNSGAAVLLSGNGGFVVKGDLKGIDGIDVAKIKSGNAASGDKVVLSGRGNVVSANNARFTDSGTDGLQLGNGNILDIEDTLTLDATSKGSGADFNVKTGNLIVGQSLTSSNLDKAIVITHSGSDVASLQLGVYEVETDAYGYETTAGAQGKLESHTAETGSVGVNLVLSGSGSTALSNLQ